MTAGFCAVYRIRRTVRRDGGSVQRLDRLMIKMAVFSALYVTSVISVFACQFYEKHHTLDWDVRAHITPCSRPDGLDHCPLDESIPPVEVYLVKTFSSLMPGMATGVWIWSLKTLRSWHSRLACCDKSQTSRTSGNHRQHHSRSAGTSSETGGRLVRWSAGLKDAPTSTPSASFLYHKTVQPYTIS